jgi:hypothetical protein
LSDATHDSIEALKEEIAKFERATRAAVSVSEKNMGVDHTGRQNRALFLFTKVIAHDMSMMAIIDCYRRAPVGRKLLDHFSIAALGRVIIDACIMTMYITRPELTRDEWNLRRYILYLHDITTRKRFILSSKTDDKEFFESYKKAKPHNVQMIRKYANLLGYEKTKIEELVNGQHVFANGVRGAVREVGWDVDEFDFMQSYLSSFVHSYPVSFMRADQHGISFSNPSDFQLKFCAGIIRNSAFVTESVTQRIELFCASISNDPLGQVDD